MSMFARLSSWRLWAALGSTLPAFHPSYCEICLNTRHYPSLLPLTSQTHLLQRNQQRPLRSKSASHISACQRNACPCWSNYSFGSRIRPKYTSMALWRLCCLHILFPSNLSMTVRLRQSSGRIRPCGRLRLQASCGSSVRLQPRSRASVQVS